ncbi:hypothetical protein UFOVP86_14 [uncultured Caudovirales phage]|uniref:Uncharacterized protein n=1 Tax=uncultured Caudovirales phage TaxID=2100421 RepID=A0A6J5TE46_9CAUD|nr:hypothetical protein UFOVP86_14 [uncultured Caudovirales phage]
MQLKNGSFCPLIKKECVQLQCAWFTQLRGTHPQTGAEIDEWMCAISAMPMLQIEVAKEARQGAAATESFRNEMVRAQVEVLPSFVGLQLT